MKDQDIINEAWKRPPTSRDLLDRAGMPKYVMPQRSGIRDIAEGSIVADMVYVFAQLGEPTCIAAINKGQGKRDANRQG